MTTPSQKKQVETKRERFNQWGKKNPWYGNYNNARQRCKPDGKYGKRGIKFLMTVQDFKKLYLRDKAHLMARPSIDRIDTCGDYIISNCRFIEYEENRRRQTKTGWLKIGKPCLVCNTYENKYRCRGYCFPCYQKKFGKYFKNVKKQLQSLNPTPGEKDG